MKELVNIIAGIIRDLPGADRCVDEAILRNRLEANRDLQQHVRAQEAKKQASQEATDRIMVNLIRIARRLDQPNLEQAFEVMQEALCNGGRLEQVEHASSMLINVARQLESDCKCGLSKTGASAEADGSTETSQSTHTATLRDIFLTLLTELDLDLGNEFRQGLQALRDQVVGAENLSQLMQHEEAIKTLFRMYSGYFQQERSRAEAFVIEIADHITELERFLLASAGYLKNTHLSNNVFTSRLAEEVDEVQNSITSIPDPAGLQQIILDKLQTLNALIAGKKKQDHLRDKAFTPELKRFRQHFGNIQGEVAKVQQENKELLEKLQTDCLTSAYNRVYYEKCLKNEFSRYKQYQRVFSLVVLDIDCFKQINDGFGHNIGDKCLQVLASEVKATLRASDPLIRYGGDEFVVLLPETGRDQAMQVAEKIRQTISTTNFMVRGQPLPLTISLGVAQVLEDDPDYKTVFDRADRALYQAKNAGRNQVKAC